ncbi:hypothetical protein BH24DEI2_BH24DEI2_21830 [soil metagenome]
MTKVKRQTTRVAAYGLVLQEEHILLCRPSSRLPKHAGYWTLPGGGLDFGEDPAAAMAREVREESGLEVTPARVAGINSFYDDFEDHAFHSIRIVYYTELISGTLSHELDGSTDRCAWWSLEQAQQLPLVDLSGYGLGLAFGTGLG